MGANVYLGTFGQDYQPPEPNPLISHWSIKSEVVEIRLSDEGTKSEVFDGRFSNEGTLIFGQLREGVRTPRTQPLYAPLVEKIGSF